MEPTPNLKLNQIELQDYIRDFVNIQFNDNMMKLDNVLERLQNLAHSHENLYTLNAITDEAVTNWNNCVNEVADILEQLKELNKLKDKVDEFSNHINDFDNPHKVTKEDVGLGNVDNLSKEQLFDSPQLTGTPTTSTPTDDSNKSQIVNIEYVEQVLNQLKQSEYWHKHDNKTTLDKISDEDLENWNSAVEKWNTSADDTAKSLRDDIDEALEGLRKHLADYSNPHRVDKDDVGLGKVDNLSRAELFDSPVMTGHPTLTETPDLETAADNQIPNIEYVKKLLDSRKNVGLDVFYSTCETDAELEAKHINIDQFNFNNLEHNFILNIKFTNGFNITSDKTITIHINASDNTESHDYPLMLNGTENISNLFIEKYGNSATETEEETNPNHKKEVEICKGNGVIQCVFIHDLGAHGSFLMLSPISAKGSGCFEWRVYKGEAPEWTFVVDENGDGHFEGIEVTPQIDSAGDLTFDKMKGAIVDENGDLTFYD